MLLHDCEKDDLGGKKDGLGALLEIAAAFGAAAWVAVGFFAVQVASKGAQLATSDADLDMGRGFANIREVRQNYDQVGAGELAFLVAIPAWGDASSVHLIAEWFWYCGWVKRNTGRDGLMAEDGVSEVVGPLPNALFAVPARAKFGFGMPASGVAAAIKKAIGGSRVSSRRVGARSRVT